MEGEVPAAPDIIAGCRDEQSRPSKSLRLADRPAIHAQLLETVGKVYRSLGESRRAAELLRESMAVSERLGAGGPAMASTMNEQAFGPRSVETAHSLNNLALLLRARRQTSWPPR